MKIRSKYMLLQTIIVATFFLSIFFIVTQLNKVARLKELQIHGVEALTQLEILTNKTVSFTQKEGAADILWEEWDLSRANFEFLYLNFLNDTAFSILEEPMQKKSRARLDSWETIQKEELEPARKRLASLISGTASYPLESSIHGVIEQYAVNQKYPPELIENLREIESSLSSIGNALISGITIPAASLLTNLETEIQSFSNFIYLQSFIIAVGIQLAGAIIGVVFAQVFGGNISLLQQSLATVSAGNFGNRLTINTRDEFEDISRNFNLVIQDLWTRLDSMKDMMQDIEKLALSSRSMQELEALVLQLAVDNTGADAALMMDIEDGMLIQGCKQGQFPPPIPLPPMVAGKSKYVEEWFSTHKVSPGEGIPGEMLEDKKPRFIRKNDGKEHRSLDSLINSAIFIPVYTAEYYYGILAVAHTDGSTYFNDLDYSYMQSYGEFIGQVFDNVRKYNELQLSQTINKEIAVAADIQKTLLPGKMPNIPGAEIAAFSDAAKGVSGDYYDVFSLEDNKTAIVICDVAGKGVPASLLMIMIRTILRTIDTKGKLASNLLVEVNRAVTGELGADRFATISLAILDSGNNSISYANGAHHPLYIFRRESRSFRTFDTDGLPLGIDANANFGHKRIQLYPGDYLILFTDGLPEARNSSGDEIGTDHLLRVVAQNSKGSPGEMCKAVKTALDTFTRGTGQHDDQTFVALKAL